MSLFKIVATPSSEKFKGSRRKRTHLKSRPATPGPSRNGDATQKSDSPHNPYYVPIKRRRGQLSQRQETPGPGVKDTNGPVRFRHVKKTKNEFKQTQAHTDTSKNKVKISTEKGFEKYLLEGFERLPDSESE